MSPYLLSRSRRMFSSCVTCVPQRTYQSIAYRSDTVSYLSCSASSCSWGLTLPRSFMRSRLVSASLLSVNAKSRNRSAMKQKIRPSTTNSLLKSLRPSYLGRFIDILRSEDAQVYSLHAGSAAVFPFQCFR